MLWFFRKRSSRPLVTDHVSENQTTAPKAVTPVQTGAQL